MEASQYTTPDNTPTPFVLDKTLQPHSKLSTFWSCITAVDNEVLKCAANHIAPKASELAPSTSINPFKSLPTMHPRVPVLIKELSLAPHPEGGFYKESYRHKGVIPADVLGNPFTAERSYATSIYFLLPSADFSAFHRLSQDELWFHHEGSPIVIHLIDAKGNHSKLLLGKDFSKGELPQQLIPANTWFAAEVLAANSYTLVSCVVTPGFDFKDFKLAERKKLITKHSTLSEIITTLTRE